MDNDHFTPLLHAACLATASANPPHGHSHSHSHSRTRHADADADANANANANAYAYAEQILKLLLDAGASWDVRAASDGGTLLHAAARVGSVRAVTACMERGGAAGSVAGNPTAVDNEGRTALHVCVEMSDIWHPEDDEDEDEDEDDDDTTTPPTPPPPSPTPPHDPKEIPQCMLPLLTLEAMQVANSQGELPQDQAAALGRPYAGAMYRRYFELLHPMDIVPPPLPPVSPVSPSSTSN